MDFRLVVGTMGQVFGNQGPNSLWNDNCQGSAYQETCSKYCDLLQFVLKEKQKKPVYKK